MSAVPRDDLVFEVGTVNRRVPKKIAADWNPKFHQLLHFVMGGLFDLSCGQMRVFHDVCARGLLPVSTSQSDYFESK